MKFCWSTLKVRKLEESVKFYTDIIGLEVEREFCTGPLNIVFLGKAETKIELICDGQNRDVNTGNDVSWGFEVDSLNDVIALVQQNKIPIEEGPIQPNPYIRYLFIKDPNGMNIQLVENIK